MTAVEFEVDVVAALARRLRAVYRILAGEEAPPRHGAPELEASVLLDRVVRAVHASPSPDQVWLLFLAVSGALPTPEDVMEGMRLFQLDPAIEVTIEILNRALSQRALGAALNELQVVSDRVVVEVDHSSRFDLHTGICHEDQSLKSQVIESQVAEGELRAKL